MDKEEMRGERKEQERSVVSVFSSYPRGQIT